MTRKKYPDGLKQTFLHIAVTKWLVHNLSEKN